MAQLVAGHAQRHRHDRMQGERPHEVGADVVAFFVRQVFGDHHRSFDRGAGVARVLSLDLDHMGRLGKSGLRVAIAEMAVADDVGTDAFVQDGGAVADRVIDRGDGWQRRVRDLDQVVSVRPVPSSALVGVSSK